MHRANAFAVGSLAAAVLIAVVLPGRTYARLLTGIGIKDGMNITTVVRPAPAEPWDSKGGLIAGGFVAFQINDLLTVQAEFLFSEKGCRLPAPTGAEDTVEKANILYFDIPVLWKFYYPRKSAAKFRPNVFLGPCWSSELNGKLLIESEEGIQESDIQNLKKTDFSLIFGSGFDIQVDNGKISFEIRYGKSHSSIFLNGKEKNRTWSVLVGYSFI